MSQPQTLYGRKRSNTAQSLLRTPLRNGEFRILNSWVHDVKDFPGVILNQAYVPGVQEGDMLRVSNQDSTHGFFMVVPREEPCKQQLQISIPRSIAETFNMRNNTEVTVTKVDPSVCAADYVEFSFQDQYLGRNDMWRLGKSLVGQCIHSDQDITFIGAIAAKIQNIYINGEKVSSACITSSTKTIYRSLSAKVTIFIQVCRELWEFSGDGERYNEKIVHSFLPSLFTKWRDAGTNHTVTIVLISRVHYDQTETDYAAGPLRKDEDGNHYKDFYKVITDLEVISDWKDTLVGLKNSFWDFQRDILLTHHYHRGSLDASFGGPNKTDQQPVRLVGHLSYAHDGPILEALNLGLNPTETHYIDRSLSHTGASTILVTPGTGYFRVNKQLLRLTTTRMLDQGFGLDLISMAKPPLHQSPIFSFQGSDPELEGDKKRDGDRKRALREDPLWGGDDGPGDSRNREKTLFWWEPFWMSVSFWDKQLDLPFRQDRFIATAKMHEIQMLGLLEHDVLSSIEVPYLPEELDPAATSRDSYPEDGKSPLTQGEKYDNDIFSFAKSTRPSNASRSSFASSANSTIISSPLHTTSAEKRMGRPVSVIPAAGRIGPIEESPRPIIMDLPSESSTSPFLGVAGVNLSTSPSQSSIRSTKTNCSISTVSSTNTARRPRDVSATRSTKSSKFAAPSWLTNPFRSNPVEPLVKTTSIVVPSSTTAAVSVSAIPVPAPRFTTVHTPIQPSPGPKPMPIKNLPNGRSGLGRNYEEDGVSSHPRTTRIRSSPVSTPPRASESPLKRRSVLSSNLSTATMTTFTSSGSASSPRIRVNPSRPGTIAHSERSLARRWQHIFPEIRYKHEIKWKSMVTPACLPLTVEHFPTKAVLDESYDVFSYEFVLDPREARSFLVKPPPASKGNDDAARRAWALVVLRGMTAIRLAQGFQFVLRSPKVSNEAGGSAPASHAHRDGPTKRGNSFMATEEDVLPKFDGAAQILQNANDPLFLSMSNEIHRLWYTGEAIQVRRYVRRMPTLVPLQYKCLIWPKLGGGYTELTTEFKSHGLENYGWNRLDMLVAGYEAQFHESLRYWRTRFVVIPTAEPPEINTGPNGEKLNEEETRLLGIDKLAEAFSKLRWLAPDEKANSHPPVRFLPTTLGPSLSVRDESLIAQLDEIHAVGPLRKKAQSEREIDGMSLNAIAKAMREEDGVPIKTNQWHRSQYADSFTGFDFVSWLAREFRDVSSRAQGAEWGVKLHDQGLFTHCRGLHGFLDGHYFYRLNGEYTTHMTPRGSWFGRTRHSGDEPHGRFPSMAKMVPMTPSSTASPRRGKKTLILSQSIVIDIDPSKRSDQAETVILHHDIIHNPATVFHFELQFIGTTARCIEDLLRQWNRTIERYGLRLVETYVTQISNIRDRNGFQSCFPLRLSVPTPSVPHLDRRVPLGTQTAHYFEYALLRRFGFIVDVEAGELYPETIDVVYSYRREPFKYSQFVHRSGVAFVQVLGGAQGFLFLTNRLMAPGRMSGGGSKWEKRPAEAAEEIRTRLHQFCEDRAELARFYEEELAGLGPLAEDVEEPPTLVI